VKAVRNGALWAGGLCFGLMGGVTALLFVLTGLELSRRIGGVAWALGLVLVGGAVCRLAATEEAHGV
jgi:hypothetical protein